MNQNWELWRRSHISKKTIELCQFSHNSSHGVILSFCASAEDKEMETYFFNFQEIGESPRVIKNELTDRHSIPNPHCKSNQFDRRITCQKQTLTRNVPKVLQNSQCSWKWDILGSCLYRERVVLHSKYQVNYEWGNSNCQWWFCGK